jgi:hypothetical protein
MTRQTSIDAYNKIKQNGLLSKRRWEVYFTLYNHGPLTSSELFEHYKKYFNPQFKYNLNVHSRLNELEERGVAQRIGTQECAVSGNTVDLWDVTSGLPVPPVKKKTKDKIIAELTDEITTLKAELSNLRSQVSTRPGTTIEHSL